MAKDDVKKTDKEVKPGAKKKEEKEDIKSKARLLIMKHPEVLYNARNLFRNENGKTIVEDRVPRGDLKREDVIMPRTQGDLTDKDLREMAVFASSIVDSTLLQYDQKVAFEDALQRAIGTKDGGKYSGKVNASTFTLILDNMGKNKKASEENAQIVPHKEGSTKEESMDKVAIQKEIESTKAKLAALEVLACDGCTEEKKEDKEAASKEAAETFACPHCGTKVLAKTGYCVKCKKKVKGDDKKEEKKEDKKEDKKEASNSITASLDEIAGVLESQNDPELLKIAYQLDLVSDVLEGKKEASTLEGDSDEKFMKEYFRAGARETDADEKFMKEFNTDLSTELKDKFQHKQLGKDASELPYKVVKE